MSQLPITLISSNFFCLVDQWPKVSLAKDTASSRMEKCTYVVDQVENLLNCILYQLK